MKRGKLLEFRLIKLVNIFGCSCSFNYKFLREIIVVDMGFKMMKFIFFVY